MSSGPDPHNRLGRTPTNPADPLQNPPSDPNHRSDKPLPALPNETPGRPENLPSSEFDTGSEHPLGPHDKVRQS
jgi:hypothetical protein